jgi:hypothetical protein
LAELLVDFAKGDVAVNRRLRLELTALAAPESLAGEVRKRLGQIERARAFVDRRSCRGLAADLEMQRRTIIDQVAKVHAIEALDLMWRFMDLAEPVQRRCDDSDGVVGGVFRTACFDLGPLAQAAKPAPGTLANRTFAALNENAYGQYDGLIELLAPALGAEGLDLLKAQFIELSAKPVEKPPQAERRIFALSSTGPMYLDEIMARRVKTAVRFALQQIANVQGDVDAFIAQYDEQTRSVPRIAAEIARRLLAVDRAKEALQVLEAADHERSRRPESEWENARIDTLDALGRRDEAQAARWSCFERALSGGHLRAYLKRLPDFEDLEAEERALEYVERLGNVIGALGFLISWPALERAARLVTLRAAELDGNRYEVLSPAADALASKYPLAATLALRAMIDFTLAQARSGRYGHAARHLMECGSLASSISYPEAFETHEAYVSRLREMHACKRGFWELVS